MMLYLRTFFVMAIGLYSSRVVLEVLGVDDFGTYSVVGGIVLIFAFFSAMLANTMSRFFAYELGIGDDAKLKQTFAAAMYVVMMIGAFVVVVCETAGVWLLSELNISESSRGAAMVVFQCSIATIIFDLFRTTFMSCLIAHDRMDVFAYFDILNSVMKLAAIFALKFVMIDKLELYGILVMLVMLLVTLGTVVYCMRNFRECHLKIRWNFSVIKPMLSYSGWNLYKTICDACRPYGVNIMINLFFGVVLNAAVAIALNVSSNVLKFTGSVFLSFKAQIIKTYAAGMIDEMQRLLYDAFKFSLCMQLIVLVPLFFEMPYILTLWLGECPDYAVIFCRLLCVSMVFETIMAILEYVINATGKMKWYSLWSGTMTLMILVVGWVVFSLNAQPQVIYVVQIIVVVMILMGNFCITKRLVPEVKFAGAITMFFKIVLILAVSCAACWMLCSSIEHDFGRLAATGTVNLAVITVGGYIFLIPSSSRSKINKKVLRIFGKS